MTQETEFDYSKSPERCFGASFIKFDRETALDVLDFLGINRVKNIEFEIEDDEFVGIKFEDYIDGYFFQVGDYIGYYPDVHKFYIYDEDDMADDEKLYAEEFSKNYEDYKNSCRYSFAREDDSNQAFDFRERPQRYFDVHLIKFEKETAFAVLDFLRRNGISKVEIHLNDGIEESLEIKFSDYRKSHTLYTGYYLAYYRDFRLFDAFPEKNLSEEEKIYADNFYKHYEIYRKRAVNAEIEIREK